MDTDNRLIRLGMAIEDAQEALESACREADAILMDTPIHGDDPPVEWPALNDLAASLAAVKVTLARLPGPEMAGAIDAAEREIDRLGDMADGLSY